MPARGRDWSSTTSTTESFGVLDSLVANAGIIPLSGIEQASAEEWEQ